MDAKVTLSFDANVIEAAKKIAEEHGISLSRLTEFLYRRIADEKHHSLEKFPVAEWVSLLAEGEAEYVTKKRGRKVLKQEFFKSRK